MNGIFICLILYFINFTKAPIPNWDFNNQSISLDLSSSEGYGYTIYNKSLYNIQVTLRKSIKIKNGEVVSKNYLKVGANNEIEVDFEDIDSHYTNKYGYDILICPKGKFHPYDFNGKNFIVPSGFVDNGEWDLRCYDHYSGHFLVFYFQNKNYNFYSYCYYTCENKIKRIEIFKPQLYDFKLENLDTNTINYEYKFPTIENDYGYLKFRAKASTMNKNDANVNRNDKNGEKKIIQVKSYTQAYFENNNSFHYFTYNNNTDFSSGYYKHSSDFLTDNSLSASSISIIENSRSPLSFIDNVDIEEMKFIVGTKYVYYKIKNNDKGTYYYGIIDIELNKVLYNLEQEEEIKEFIPILNSGEMLAITSNSAYKICIVKSSDTCLTPCSNLVLDPELNKCQDSGCDSGKIKMVPEGYCIKEELCNTSIYIIKKVNGENQCGLCSYFNTNGEIHRLIGAEGCLSNMPENTEYYNENLYLLKCKTNYHLESNSCVPDTCFIRCEECSQISDNENDQKCTSCKSGFNLVSGNCVIPPTTIVMQAPTTIYTPPTTIFTPPTVIIESPSTQIKEIPRTNCLNKRCKECNNESDEMNLCISCDSSLYEKVNYTQKFSKYFDCVKKENLENKFYLDIISNQYKPCYEKCKKCSGPGNATSHNCLECEHNYMFRPGDNPGNNCVVYSKYYFISPYGNYIPLSSPQCPEEAKFTIKNDEKKEISCIYDCKVDKVYKYLYNGNCIKDCSEIDGTENVNFICKEIDINKIYISEKPIYLDTEETINVIETLAMTYAQEFNYTNNHISLHKNEEITVALYKNKSIIGDTDLTLPNIDFGDCYEKVKNFYNISEDNIIISIIDKKVRNNPSTFYLFFHPETGRKLEAGEICKNETIEVKENLLNMLDAKNENYDLQISLTKKGINIFDINDPYYKDICYDFDNPKNRDIALKDRLKETFVNVTLCDDGCINTGIDVRNNVATCNCKFNEVTDNDLIHENVALEYLVGELFEFINSSNILVLKCYKYIFKYFGDLMEEF